MTGRPWADVLSVLVLVLCLGLWLADGLKLAAINPQVLGGTIAAFTLVIQFYFRKKPGGG